MYHLVRGKYDKVNNYQRKEKESSDNAVFFKRKADSVRDKAKSYMRKRNIHGKLKKKKMVIGYFCNIYIINRQRNNYNN